jgi:2-polyprenyl-3-methyl-5-hydroxy-6-metoxy-1,4-benzoquinol methylase
MPGVYFSRDKLYCVRRNKKGWLLVSKIIEEFYNKHVDIEWGRLDRHPLEFEITKKHINEILGKNQLILDIGGGPGRYSFHYASLGHKVTLIDLSPANIEFAKSKQTELHISLENIEVGNAISLKNIEDNHFDVIFCMGPLYHIINETDRQSVIKECKRICKQNGFIVFSFINKMAQTISVIQKFPEKIEEWTETLEKGIEERLNNTQFDGGFTEAFFVDPLEVESYISRHDLSVVKVAGAEGLVSQSEMILKKLPSEIFQKWIDFSYKYSTDKSILGASQHIICIAQKR